MLPCEIVLRDIRDIEHGFIRQQVAFSENPPLVLRHGDSADASPLFQRLFHPQHEIDLVLQLAVAVLGQFFRP